MITATEKIGKLSMVRDGVTQVYRLLKAHWGSYVDEHYKTTVVGLVAQAERQPSIFPDDDGWSHGPEWTIAIWAAGFTTESVQTGLRIEIPDDWDEYTGRVFTNFYYDEHDHTVDNIILVGERHGGSIRLRIEGRISDENPGMMPTQIFVDATFHLATDDYFLGGFTRNDLPPHPPPFNAKILPITAGAQPVFTNEDKPNAGG